MDLVSLRQPFIEDIGPIGNRQAETGMELRLPANTRIISADGHWEIAEDIFYENFPARLKDKAPRVWFDGYQRIGYRNEMEAFPLGQRALEIITRCNGDTTSIATRLRDMDAERVEMEICFPNTLTAFVRYPDLEVQEHMYRVYNDYMVSRMKESGGRCMGVGILSNWWDGDQAEAAMRQIVDLGLKTFMLPCSPGGSASWADPQFDHMWSVIAEAGLPMCFHVGEGLDLEHRGAIGANNMILMASFRKPFGQLIFGGVFDRNPSLQVVFVEGGIAWIPPVLQDAEHMYDSFGNGDLIDRLDHRPSHYWRTNCYATFQRDNLGLSQLDIIGADRVMWGADYPHSEGTFGYGRTAIQAVADKLSPDDARKVLGGNATKVFGLAA
jgi:predicted TIM-barrel fold metal-dependent hydrolase